MNKTEEKFKEIRAYCETHANKSIEAKYARYFTEGYDAYGLDKNDTDQWKKWLEDWKNEMTFDDYLQLGSRLISTGKYEEASFAIVFNARFADQYRKDHFSVFGKWLEKDIKNWAHTDILCGMILARFPIQKIVSPQDFASWTRSSSKWKRRAVPVTFIDILKTGISVDTLLEIIDPLMPDPDKFVQKGLGWFLREAWKIYPESIEKYLIKWKDTCGRTIIQYATEKMDKEYRKKFARSK
ncbi:MAG: DNA alkylation repair protein [Bacteroidales bacterium]|nr:DNA alkylation repair protein [Bacteroidales bacterium]